MNNYFPELTRALCNLRIAMNTVEFEAAVTGKWVEDAMYGSVMDDDYVLDLSMLKNMVANVSEAMEQVDILTGKVEEARGYE